MMVPLRTDGTRKERYRQRLRRQGWGAITIPWRRRLRWIDSDNFRLILAANFSQHRIPLVLLPSERQKNDTPGAI